MRRPSGQVARQPKEGVVGYNSVGSSSSDRRSHSVQRNQKVDQMKRDTQDVQLVRMQPSTVIMPDYDDLRRQLSYSNDKILSLNNDVNNLKSAMDRQLNNLRQMDSDIKSRPIVDPSKIANTTQQMDGKMRDLSSQIVQLKQSIHSEREERLKEKTSLADKLQRLQDSIRDQNKTKTDLLNNLARKSDSEKEKLSQELKRLTEKVNTAMGEISKNTMEGQNRLKNELLQKIAALEAGSRSQSAKDDETSRKTRQELEERLRLQEEHGASLSKQLSEERAKQKNRFQKVNEALAAFEQNIELGHNKMDTAMNSEIQRRKLHEKSLFSKMTEIEDRLNTYVGNLTNSINQIKSGKENVKIPSLDIDGLRREMEAIAADKSKVSMEGLLKLEEKMARVQTGLVHDRKEITQQISKMSDSDDVDKVKDQLKKLTNVNDEMEKTQDIIRDKVDKQIPKDLNELSSKTDNIRQQLNARLDKEEEERFLAIKELQEAFHKLHNNSGNSSIAAGNSAQIRRDLDECKVAIKKLAESVTTVKNVLDKKITDESRKREAEISRLSHS